MSFGGEGVLGFCKIKFVLVIKVVINKVFFLKNSEGMVSQILDATKAKAPEV